MTSTAKHTAAKFTVREILTGDTFGNHTYSEATSRARIMERNWGYKKRFDVVPLTAEMVEQDRAALSKAEGGANV